MTEFYTSIGEARPVHNFVRNKPKTFQKWCSKHFQYYNATEKCELCEKEVNK